MLSELGKSGCFKALYVGYNQPFKREYRDSVIQLNVTPLEYVDVVSMGEYVPFPDNSFDLVVLSGVIEHTQSPFKVVDESYRVLKPEGKIYVSSPWVYPFHGGDNYRFSYSGLKLLCHKFENVETGILTIVLDNGFPFSFDANIYLEDEDHVILDTLVFQNYVASGLLDNEFKVEQVVKTRIPLTLTPDLKESIVQARFARYEMLINSAENEHVKIFDDNVMVMKLIGDFTFAIEQ